MTPSSSLSVGQSQTQISQSNLKKRPSVSIKPVPLFGSVVVSDGDRVHFGGGGQSSGSTQRKRRASANESSLPTIPEGEGLPPPEEASSIGSVPTPEPEGASQKPKKPAYGYYRNNFYAGMGMVFNDVVPIALCLPNFFMPGIWGASAGLVLSRVSGKVGRWISKDVDKQNLNPFFKYMSEVRSVISDTPQEGAPSPVTRLNQALNDLLNVQDNSMTSRAKRWLLGKLTLSANIGLGQKIEGLVKKRLQAGVNHAVANEETLGGAAKAAGKGVLNYGYYSILNTIGTALASSNIWFIKPLGIMLQNAALCKFGFDMARKAPEQPQPAAQAQTV